MGQKLPFQRAMVVRMSKQSAHSSKKSKQDTTSQAIIDRNKTIKIKRIFLNFNRAQLQRIYESLGLHQRCVLALLPLLFHINHASLPGYVGLDCPSGLSDYTLSHRALSQAKKHARSFSLGRGVVRRVEVLGLYLMGSSGTIAQSSRSDFDI